MDRLVDIINGGRVDLMRLPGFVKRRARGISERVRISAHCPVDYSGFGVDIDVEAEFIDQIKREVSMHCYNIIFKDISETYSFSVHDFRGMSEREVSSHIVDEIKAAGFKNAVVSPKIGTLIQDSASFVISSESMVSIRSGSDIYMIGSIYGYHDVYVDPYMKWDDNRLLLFSDAFADASGFRCSDPILDCSTFRPRMIIEFDFSCEIADVHSMFVRDDSNPEIDPRLVSKMRDQKITRLLDEED
jgi:hypothetical protein